MVSTYISSQYVAMCGAFDAELTFTGNCSAIDTFPGTGIDDMNL